MPHHQELASSLPSSPDAQTHTKTPYFFCHSVWKPSTHQSSLSHNAIHVCQHVELECCSHMSNIAPPLGLGRRWLQNTHLDLISNLLRSLLALGKQPLQFAAHTPSLQKKKTCLRPRDIRTEHILSKAAVFSSVQIDKFLVLNASASSASYAPQKNQINHTRTAFRVLGSEGGGFTRYSCFSRPRLEYQRSHPSSHWQSRLSAKDYISSICIYCVYIYIYYTIKNKNEKIYHPSCPPCPAVFLKEPSLESHYAQFHKSCYICAKRCSS